jgi:hypothetical protein
VDPEPNGCPVVYTTEEVGGPGDGYGAVVGNYFEIIAGAEAIEDEAPGRAALVVDWLTREGIIAAEPANCVLGAESGYPPGPRYAAAVTEPDERLLGLWANGVEVCTSRAVFSPSEGPWGQ